MQVLTSAADQTEEVRRLGMGRLLSDLAKKMQYKVDKPSADPLRLVVHSTHDTALAGLTSTLDVFDDKSIPCTIASRTLGADLIVRWPAFTSAITFELFQRDHAAPADVEGTQPKYVQSVKQNVLGALGRGNGTAEHCESIAFLQLGVL